MKLVMTLLVRDEADIVRDNITFHLERGVDHVVVTDNGSEDGTRDILAEFERLGTATVIDEPEQNYAQAEWVTRMAMMAREEKGADWILNNDADEFWVSPSGNLKAGLGRAKANAVRCQRLNMVFACDDEQPGAWYERIVHRVARPMQASALADRMNDPLPCPYFYMDLPAKVLVRAAGLVSIKQGNHQAVHERRRKPRASNIVIYHYPARSAAQFCEKVMQGGAAYARNENLPESAGWHWRRWHKMLLEGRRQEVLEEALPTGAALREDIEAGIVVRDETMCHLLGESIRRERTGI